jgi:hypothetical protein
MQYKVKHTVLMLCGLLTACGHNPLQQKSTHDAARLLTDASLVAMKEVSPQSPNKSDHYRLCMEQLEEKGFNCNALYKAMSENLQAQGLKVSPAQLRDKTLYKTLADDLKELSYYSI